MVSKKYRFVFNLYVNLPFKIRIHRSRFSDFGKFWIELNMCKANTSMMILTKKVNISERYLPTNTGQREPYHFNRVDKISHVIFDRVDKGSHFIFTGWAKESHIDELSWSLSLGDRQKMCWKHCCKRRNCL